VRRVPPPGEVRGVRPGAAGEFELRLVERRSAVADRRAATAVTAATCTLPADDLSLAAPLAAGAPPVPAAEPVSCGHLRQAERGLPGCADAWRNCADGAHCGWLLH
jgi:hypothetical protein